MTKTRIAVCAAVGLVTAAAFGISADAQDVADFYKDKRATMFVGNPPGGGYDSYARLTARHMTRFIPGNPPFIVQNMPGAGGLRVTGHMYNVAPRDGTAMALIQRAILSAPLLEPRERQMNFDVMKFNWIGSLSSDIGFVMAWHTTPHHKMEDLFEHELIIGSSNPSSEVIPLFLNNVLGTKLKIVSGYKSGTEILLAMERGEVQGRIVGSTSGLDSVLGPWIKENKVRFLAVTASRRSQQMPDVPILREFAKDRIQAQMIDLILASQHWGRPYLLPPDVPADRVKAVREAFYQMTRDKSFLEEAENLKLNIDLVTGEEIDELLKELYAMPPEVVQATQKAITPN